MSRNFGDREGSNLRRPPLAVVLVAVVVIALGETGGAAMSRLKPQIERYVAARVAANPQTHDLSGSAEYDDEVRDRAVFAVEAGLSFFHTHAEGVGLIVFFASTLVASVVPWRRARAALYLALTAGGLFPLGYLVYGVAVLEAGRDAGIELAERGVLTPLGSAPILGLIGLELTRWARNAMLARPAVHGLVGVRDVDERVLDEALVKFDAGLRLFHLHAEGMGLVILATTTVAATLASSPAPRRSIIALLTVGGAGYPLGYLLWSGLIPYHGLERGKTIAEWLVWVSVGGATIVALLWLARPPPLELCRHLTH